MLNNNNNNKGKEKAQDKAIQDKIDDLPRAVDRLKHLQAHDALVILKNSMAIPKLLYLLRTSQCSDNPLLRQFDDTLLTGLITILNVDINNDQWLQASLPVGDGDLGIRSAEMLAPSAYLASAASTLLHSDARRSVGGVYRDIMDRPGQLSKTPSANTTHPESLGWTSCSRSKELNPFQSSI